MQAILTFRIKHLEYLPSVEPKDRKELSISSVVVNTDLPDQIAQALINDQSRIIEIEIYSNQLHALPIKLCAPALTCNNGNYGILLTVSEEGDDLISSELSRPNNPRYSKRQRLRDDIKNWKAMLSGVFGEGNVSISWDYGLKP